MSDVLFVGIFVVFLAGCLGYVQLCRRIVGPGDARARERGVDDEVAAGSDLEAA